MLEQKFIKSLLSICISSAILNSYGASTDPVNVTDAKATNEEYILGEVTLDKSNTEYTNNGFIKNKIFFKENPTSTFTNIGAIKFGGNTLDNSYKDPTGSHSPFVTKNIYNYGLAVSKAMFLPFEEQTKAYDGDFALRNLGKIKDGKYFLYGTDKQAPINDGLIVADTALFKTEKESPVLNFVNNGVVSAPIFKVDTDDNQSNTQINAINNGISVIAGQFYIGAGGDVTMPDGSKKTIINGQVSNVYGSANAPHILSSTNGNSFNNNILNAHSIIFDNANPTTITSSIVNAGLDLGPNKANSKTDITFTDSIYNGSYDTALPVINSGDNTTTKISFTGKSIINGDIKYKNVGNGITNELNIQSSATLNGDLDGNVNKNATSKSTLNINGSGSDNLKIFHSIRNFNEMNISSNATLYDIADIKNVQKIDLQNNGNLYVKVDTTKKDANGDISGNALYGNTGTVVSTGGKFIVDAFPADPQEEQIISFGGTTLDDSLWGKDYYGNPVGTTDDKIESASTLVDYDRVSANQIKITVKKDLGQNVAPEYNEIYQAIVNSGNVGELADTSHISKSPNPHEQVYWTLEQIYSANPYGYTMKSNLDSLRLFKEVDYKTVMPRQGENLFTVRAIYTGNYTDNYASGRGFYNERNLKTETNTVGALITNEFGLDNKVLGVALGYNKQSVKFKELSNIKSDNIYAGLFLKNRFGNFQTKIGADYQFTRSKVEHNIVNFVDSFSNKAKLNNHTISAYLEGKYSFNLTDSFSISPVANVAYYNIRQGAVDEGVGRLATKVEKENINLVDVGGGLDFGYRTFFINGALKQVLHLGAVGTFGETDKTMHGSFTGTPNRYRFKAVEIPDVMGKVGYKVEYESLSKFVYSLGGNYEFGKRNQNFDVHVGLGYKF